jgi:hypothetical protein
MLPMVGWLCIRFFEAILYSGERNNQLDGAYEREYASSGVERRGSFSGSRGFTGVVIEEPLKGAIVLVGIACA